MRIIADENVHSVVVASLRTAGHEVEWIAETASGVGDRDILGRADIAELVLITYDRDFGDLIFNQGAPVPLGLIYSRMGRAEPELLARRMLALIETGVVAGQMIVIEPDKNRSRALGTGKL